MKYTADTNVILRIALVDDLHQHKLALDTVKQAELVALPIHSLCEFVWVLKSRYKRTSSEAAGAVRRLLEMPNIYADQPAVEAGLQLLDAGGDFADGVIDFDGNRLGGEAFLTFDRNAAMLMEKTGRQVVLLA